MSLPSFDFSLFKFHCNVHFSFVFTFEAAVKHSCKLSKIRVNLPNDYVVFKGRLAALA